MFVIRFNKIGLLTRRIRYQRPEKLKEWERQIVEWGKTGNRRSKR